MKLSRPAWVLAALLALPLGASDVRGAGGNQPGAYCPLPKKGETPRCLEPAIAEYGEFFSAIDEQDVTETRLARLEADVAAGAEAENAYVIEDLYAPSAPVHLLVIPKRRYASVLEPPAEVLGEMLELHLKMDKESQRKRAVDLLRQVGITDAERRIDAYPHQFSGGMRQRVMIAMAISCNPKIIIADEPTTALDVTTQAQLLELMVDLVTRLNTSLIIVTHNLGVVARYVQRIYVMYAGRIVESGSSEDIFENPRHPYTIGLMRSVPRLGEKRGSRKLIPIEGMPPDLIYMPPTCAFLPRCPYKIQKCQEEPWPALRQVGEKHYTACFVDIGEKV